MNLEVGAPSRHLQPSRPKLMVVAIVSLSGCFSPETADDTHGDSSGTTDAVVSGTDAAVSGTTLSETTSANVTDTTANTDTGSDTTTSPMCGNGIEDPGEECDYGDLLSNSG